MLVLTYMYALFSQIKHYCILVFLYSSDLTDLQQHYATLVSVDKQKEITMSISIIVRSILCIGIGSNMLLLPDCIKFYLVD